MADFKRQYTGGETGRSKDGATASAVWTAFGYSSGDDAIDSPDCPVRVNDPWPDDPGLPLKCSNVRASTIKPGAYRIVATFSVPPDGQEHTGIGDGNPLNAPVEFRWETVRMSLQVERDVDGNPILMSSGRGVDPPVYKTFNAKELTVIRNEPAFSLPTAQSFENTLNAGVFSGATEKTVMCTEIVPLSTYTDSASYIRVGYRFLFMSEGIFGSDPHNLRVLDQDTMTRGVISTDDGLELVRLCNKSGQNLDYPALLDGGGKPLDDNLTYRITSDIINTTPIFSAITPDGAAIEQSPTGAVFLRYQLYPTSNFNNLGLPV